MSTSYAYYLQFGDKLRYQSIGESFDPASISKIFYALYVLQRFDLAEIAKIKLPVSLKDLRRFGHGTRSIRWWNLSSEYSLSELLYLSIVNSCNVATGIIADFVGRDNVNLFIGEKLNLPNTSVYSATKPNTTTVSDLLSCLQQITEQQILTDSERDYLYDLLAQTKRRGVIRKSLPTNIKVFSKGGTTFSGLRRDASIVFDLQFPDPGFIIVVQLSDASHAYSLIDNLAAKFHLGPKAKRLQQLDSEFNQYVHQLLNA